MHRSVELAAIAAAGALAVMPVPAQTIADYSRAQRAQIEASIARQAPSVVPLPTLAAAGAGSPAAAHLPARGALPAPLPATVEPPPARMAVSGVVSLPDRRLAEVTVDGAAYLLAPGDKVPGTAWTLKAVNANEVLMWSASGRRAPRAFQVGDAVR